jgi:hypothetical protein
VTTTWLDDDHLGIPPAVLGVESDSPPRPDSDDESSLVYLPSQPVRRGDREAVLELRHVEDGSLALLAFSSLEDLVAGCGEHQPWVAVSAEHLPELQRLSGAEHVLWDAELPEPLRRAVTADG